MFNTKQVPVLHLVTPDGGCSYPMAHDLAEGLLGRAYSNGRDGVIEFTDDDGKHVHPVRHVYAAHLLTQQDHSGASVELWQDQYGTAYLYLVDPETPDTAWRIHPKHLTAGSFAGHAQQLIEGGMRLAEIAGPVDTSGLTNADQAAVYRPGTGVILTTETRNSSRPSPVAGPTAQRYAGDRIAGTTHR